MSSILKSLVRSASRHRRALQAEGYSCAAAPRLLHGDDGPWDVLDGAYYHDASAPGSSLQRPAAAEYALAAIDLRRCSSTPLVAEQQAIPIATDRRQHFVPSLAPHLQPWIPCWHACHTSSMPSISSKWAGSIAAAAWQLSGSHRQQRGHQTDSRQAHVAEANAVMQVP